MVAMASELEKATRQAIRNDTRFSQLFIGGKFVDPASDEYFSVTSPIDGSDLCSVAIADASDVDRAVRAARDAFESGVWSGLAPAERKAVLMRLGDLIGAHAEELGAIVTLDTGKPIGRAISEVNGAAKTPVWFAEMVDKVYGDTAPMGPSYVATVTHEPVGVAAAITPWNFPISMPMNKIAPALATGNSVVVKPAEQSSLVILRLAELVAEAGVPDGVFNVITGLAATGNGLVRHPAVDAIGFTGSTAVGKKITAAVGESTLKKLSLELGGKSPVVVFDDAPDLDTVAEEVAASIFFNSGQVCDAGSRLIVHESIAEEMIAKVIEHSRTWLPGDPFDRDAMVGSVIDEGQLERIRSYIEIGRSEGAEIRAGGNRLREDSGGFYFEPTIFTGVQPDMRIAQEEIFGPVLSVLTFRTDEEAVDLANNTSFGLGAGVWTKDVGRAHRISRRIRAGVVYVNCYDHFHPSLPFGGVGQSGFGRDKNKSALDNYTEMKATVVNIDR